MELSLVVEILQEQLSYKFRILGRKIPLSSFQIYKLTAAITKHSSGVYCATGHSNMADARDGCLYYRKSLHNDTFNHSTSPRQTVVEYFMGWCAYFTAERLHDVSPQSKGFICSQQQLFPLAHSHSHLRVSCRSLCFEKLHHRTHAHFIQN